MGGEITTTDIQALTSRVKSAFSKVKEEMGDHLCAINENTDEINCLQGQINELSEKVENLSIKMDEVLMALGTKSPFEEQISKEITLTFREQEIFMALYIADDPMRYRDIARRVGLTEYIVQDNAAKLIAKGIPIIKQIKDDEMFLSLDVEFKALQAKKNILKIDDSISKQLMSTQYL